MILKRITSKRVFIIDYLITAAMYGNFRFVMVVIREGFTNGK